MDHTLLFEKDKPPGIDWEMVFLFHQEPDGFIPFMQKDSEGNLYPVAAFNVLELQRDLKTILPQLRPYVLRDGYMGINATSRAGGIWKKTGMPYPLRKQAYHLKYLNACLADLDIGRTDKDAKSPEQLLTFPDALSRIVDAGERGELLQPSVIARSGRGCYLAWFLDDHGSRPEVKYKHWKEGETGRARTTKKERMPELLGLYKRIQTAIIENLKPLAADPAVKSPNQVIKLPGTIDTKSGNIATYYLAGKGKEIFKYSMEEIAQAFNVTELENALPEKARGFSYKQNKSGKIVPNRRKGLIAVNARRAQDLIIIEQWKGGIERRIPGRCLTLNFYAQFLLRSKHTEKEIRKALEYMAKNCRPSYPSDPGDPSLREIIKAANKEEVPGNEFLCKRYGITPEIAIELNLQTIIPPELKELLKNQPTPQEIDRDIRRQAIRDFVSIQGPYKPGCRALVKMLAEIGIPTNRTTVAQDLKNIGLEILKPGRPKRVSNIKVSSGGISKAKGTIIKTRTRE